MNGIPSQLNFPNGIIVSLQKEDPYRRGPNLQAKLEGILSDLRLDRRTNPKGCGSKPERRRTYRRRRKSKPKKCRTYRKGRGSKRKRRSTRKKRCKKKKCKGCYLF